MRLFRSHSDALGDRRLVAAVGRDRCAVDVDAALHAHSAAVGQIPCYRHRPLSMRSNNPVTGEENKLLVIHNSTNNNRSFFIILLR